MEALIKIQSELKANKSQYNSFGKYYYRSCEDILEALKPLLTKYNATMYITDEVVEVGGRVYVKATTTISDGKESISVSAYAREPETRKGMDDAQVTGATSSYARKYCLNGLFAIDDSKDADTDENRNESEARSKASGGSDTPKSDTPKVQRPNYSEEQLAKMKKWTDGTFTNEELAEFRKRCCGPDYADAIEDINGEYEKRKAIF